MTIWMLQYTRMHQKFVMASTMTVMRTIDDNDSSIDTTTQMTFYTDADGDGYGDLATEMMACDAVDGAVDNGDDCNDADAMVHPMAEEMAADGIDQDCDGMEHCYLDADDDGYGVESMTTIAADAGVFDCDAAANASSTWDDCDDADAGVNAGRNDYVCRC